MSEIILKHHKTRLVVSKIARKIESDDRMNSKFATLTDESMRPLPAEEDVVPRASITSRIPKSPENVGFTTEPPVTDQSDILAQVATSLVKSEENCKLRD